MILLHLKYQLLVTEMETLWGKIGNKLKVASFFYQ